MHASIFLGVLLPLSICSRLNPQQNQSGWTSLKINGRDYPIAKDYSGGDKVPEDFVYPVKEPEINLIENSMLSLVKDDKGYGRLIGESYRADHGKLNDEMSKNLKAYSDFFENPDSFDATTDIRINDYDGRETLPNDSINKRSLSGSFRQKTGYSYPEYNIDKTTDSFKSVIETFNSIQISTAESDASDNIQFENSEGRNLECIDALNQLIQEHDHRI